MPFISNRNSVVGTQMVCAHAGDHVDDCISLALQEVAKPGRAFYPTPVGAAQKTKPTEPYLILASRDLGNPYGYASYTYEITFNKRVVNRETLLNALNHPRAATWLGRVWDALRNR